MDEIKHYFEELEPRSLNHFIEKVYNQTKDLIKEYEENRIWYIIIYKQFSTCLL